MGRASWLNWSLASATPPAASAPATSAPVRTPDESSSSLGSSVSDASLSARLDGDTLPSDLGTLIVVVMKAKNLHNRRAISKQNPYCSVRVANSSERTRTITRGGQAPVWDHEARFRLGIDDDCRVLKLCVFDQSGSSTEIIGDAIVPLKPALEAPPKQGFDSWYPIHYNKRYVGEVYLEMTFYPQRRSPRSGRGTRSGRTSANSSLKHSESMPALDLRSLDMPSYMGTRPQRSPSPVLGAGAQVSSSGGRRNSRPLPQAPADDHTALQIAEPLNALRTSMRVLPFPNPELAHSIHSSAAAPLRMPLPRLPDVPDLPDVPNVPDVPDLPRFGFGVPPKFNPAYDAPVYDDAEAPPCPPHHASSVPSLSHVVSPAKTAQEDISKQINDRYEASLFERLRPPASRPY